MCPLMDNRLEPGLTWPPAPPGRWVSESGRLEPGAWRGGLSPADGLQPTEATVSNSSLSDRFLSLCSRLAHISLAPVSSYRVPYANAHAHAAPSSPCLLFSPPIPPPSSRRPPPPSSLTPSSAPLNCAHPSTMDDSLYSILPPPPPKPDFANRIKLKHRYSELKAQFHQITNLKNALEAELAEKESKESKLRMECNLILDQIELIRTRLPPKTEPEPSEPDQKRFRRHQDKCGGFLYESDDQLAFDDTDAESDEDEDAEGEGEREEDEEGEFEDGREHGLHGEGDEEAEGEEEEDEDGHSAAEANPPIHPAASL